MKLCGRRNTDRTPPARLRDYPQFAPFGRLLPNDLDILLEVIEELVQLSSKAADL